jgi:RNA polymerase sigma factor (sigma-70 family)
MASPDEEVFFRMARAWAKKQTYLFGLQGDFAEDCIQSFVVKWLFKSYHPPLWTWPKARCHAFLRRASRNHVLNFITACQRRRKYEGLDYLESRCREPACLSAEAERDFLPEVYAEKELFWEQIEVGLQVLTPSQCALLIRYHLENAAIAEIAASSGRSVHAIEQSLSNARKRLRSALIAQGNTEAELRSYVSLPANRAYRMKSSYRQRHGVEEGEKI